MFFDEDQAALFIFDDTGAYHNKIHRIGQGPDEYRYIYDFYIDTLQSQIGMLSPFGQLFHYGFNGVLIKKTDLPNPPPAYRRMELLPDQTCLFWSFPDDEAEYDVLNIISMETGEKTGGFDYNENDVLTTWTSQDFHSDEQGNVYLIRSFINEVFMVTPDGLKIAYAWDFGEQNVNVNKHKFPNTIDRSNNTILFMNAFNNGETSRYLPYCFSYQNQTNLYYYAYMRFAFMQRKHLFYNKKTSEYHHFERTEEGILINSPLLMTNEYMLAEFSYEEKELIKPYLFSDKDRKILTDFREDDNPCLVKFTFKK